MAKKKFDAAFTVMEEIESIPEALRDILVPTDPEELILYELNVLNWVSKKNERKIIHENWSMYQDVLPLKCRRCWSLRRILSAVKIIKLKKKRKPKWEDNNDGELM